MSEEKIYQQEKAIKNLKKKICKMQRAFAAIECAIIHKCDRYNEFVIGECEYFRGKYEPRCVCQTNQ